MGCELSQNIYCQYCNEKTTKLFYIIIKTVSSETIESGCYECIKERKCELCDYSGIYNDGSYLYCYEHIWIIFYSWLGIS